MESLKALLASWARSFAAASLAVYLAGVTDPNHPIYCYGIAEKEYYFRHIERKVVRVNLMSGVEYEESVNTPLACSPASETYWSM